MLFRSILFVLTVWLFGACGVLYYKVPQRHLNPETEANLLKDELLAQGVDTLVLMQPRMHLYHYIEPIGKTTAPVTLYWVDSKGKSQLAHIDEFQIRRAEIPRWNLDYFVERTDTLVHTVEPVQNPVRGMRQPTLETVLDVYVGETHLKHVVHPSANSKKPAQRSLRKLEEGINSIPSEDWKMEKRKTKLEWKRREE